MNVGVIGTANRDTLILPNRTRVTSWGGIVYNVLTLSHYLKNVGNVRVISPVGANLQEDFLALLQRFDNVDLSGLKFYSQRHNRVLLKCLSQDEKEETAELSLPELPFDFISQHLPDLEFLLVNFTSGRDVSLETLRCLRAAFSGPLFVDVHSLTLSDPDSKSKRRLRVLHDWQEWLEGMDYVQMTWQETASLTGEGKTTFAKLVWVADWLLERGTKGIIVTRGAEGAYYFYADEHGILKEEVPPFPIQTLVDTTGCGDVFSAAFIYHLLMRSEDAVQAAHFASRAASLKATFSGLGPWLVES